MLIPLVKVYFGVHIKLPALFIQFFHINKYKVLLILNRGTFEGPARTSNSYNFIKICGGILG